MGYHLILVATGSKIPATRWKDAPALTESDLASLPATHERRPNFAVLTGKSGIAVLDCDDAEATAWVSRHCPPSPMRVETPRGGLHVYFADDPKRPLKPKVRIGNMGLDIRAGMSIAIVPDSWSDEERRCWRFVAGPLPPAALPQLPADVFAGLTKTYEPPTAELGAMSPRASSGPIRDVRRWIMAVESIQGLGGSNQCFKVACRLVDAGLSYVDAWRWLCLWNLQKAIPPWSEAELRHKLRDAFRRPAKEER